MAAVAAAVAGLEPMSLLDAIPIRTILWGGRRMVLRSKG